MPEDQYVVRGGVQGRENVEFANWDFSDSEQAGNVGTAEYDLVYARYPANALF